MDPIKEFLFERRRSEDNRADHYQRQESSESRILDIQRAQRESLLRQSELLCAEDQRRTNAVLQRLGLSAQQDPLPPPQPPAGYRQRPESSVRGRRLRPLDHVTTYDNQRRSELVDEGVEELDLSDRGSISSVDSHTPDELRAIPLIVTPVEMSPPQTPFTPSPPPPTAPRPRRRTLSRLPVMTPFGGADKEVGGDNFQKAQAQLEKIQRSIAMFHGNAVQHSPQPPTEPKRNPAVRSVGAKQKRQPTVQSKNTRMSHECGEDPIKNPDPEVGATPLPAVTPFKPAPPPNPAPPRKTGPRRGTSVKPAKTNNAGKNNDSTCTIGTADSQNVEELPPLSRPVEALMDCFRLLSSEDWEKKTEGLRTIRILAQRHPETLMAKLHEVCLVLVEEVKNLRSSVASAAMDTLRYMFIYLQKDMDPQVERTGITLLLKIAQAAANAFIQQQANLALGAMVLNCSSGRVLNALLNTGLSHKCAAVRASAAQQLRLLAHRLGADSILTAGKSSAQRFLRAVTKMALDAAAEVRPHGHAVLQQLALHEDFNDLWKDIVADKDRRVLEKVVRSTKAK